MIYWKQLQSLILHKYYFFRAGRYLGISWRLIILHDLSKLSPVEFVNYARWKYGVKSMQDWAWGWFHHLHRNRHHPEHWVLIWCGDPNSYSDIALTLTEYVAVWVMPARYVREMVADFMATSREVTGSYDIGDWLNEHGPKRLMHDDTKTRLHAVMVEAGYALSGGDWTWTVGDRFKKWDRTGSPLVS